ncbi:MAG TPA: terminase family protein [Alloacidobacterium sp.]|nr:terminase family protein [Alloacidobacterium sp.]
MRRELYSKHLAFFEAGKEYRERAVIAGNRTGKSYGIGGYEMALHLTGLYPDWWKGKRFDHAVNAWCATDTNRQSRDILQAILMGRIGEFGTGLLPSDTIVRHSTKVGIADAVESVFVKHVSGSVSELGFKSYDGGREVFQGTSRHVIWLDEEPPKDVYVESLLRTMDCDGVVMATFTPMLGMSEICRDFLTPQKEAKRYVVQIEWDEVPHLSEQAKAELLASIPEYQREARSKGIPVLGAGAIYPVDEKDVLIDPFELPKHYPRAYGLDVGWNRTAAIWMAVDRDTGTHYLYHEHYRGKAEPEVHVAAIKSVGPWIPGVIDPASRGRSQIDGRSLITEYRRQGLILAEADNAVEAGLYKVWSMLTTGKLKAFKGLQNWLSEFRLYQRNDSGDVVKSNDHLMDAMRYVVMSGASVMTQEPAYLAEKSREIELWRSNWNSNMGESWMQ